MGNEGRRAKTGAIRLDICHEQIGMPVTFEMSSDQAPGNPWECLENACAQLGLDRNKHRTSPQTDGADRFLENLRVEWGCTRGVFQAKRLCGFPVWLEQRPQRPQGVNLDQIIFHSLQG
jgi:hypothetical protein